MLTTVCFIIVLGILVIVHEFGHFIVAKRMGVCVEKFSIGFGPEIIGITKGGTRYSVSLIPLGGYVKLKGEIVSEEIKGDKSEYMSRSIGERARVIFAGPLLNYILAFLIFSFVFMIGSPTRTSQVGEIMPGYPAESSGLKAGDKILNINGKDVIYWDDVTKIVHTSKDQEMKLFVERGSQKLTIFVTPKSQDMKTPFGSKKRLSVIGIMPSKDFICVKYGFFKAIFKGAETVWEVTYTTYRAFWAIITRSMPAKDAVTGPIGIWNIIDIILKFGIVALLQFIATLSASLAIFNLLPVPVLDGGHILFLAIEKIRKKPVSLKMQENVTNVGMSLLIALMLFVFYNDFIRFGIFEKILHLWRR